MAGNTKYKNDWQKEHTDRIILVVPKGQKEIIHDHAQMHSESLNGFIKRAIEETMKNDHDEDRRKQRVAETAKESGKSIEEVEDDELEEAALSILEKKVKDIRKLYSAAKAQQERSRHICPVTTLSPAKSPKQNECSKRE